MKTPLTLELSTEEGWGKDDYTVRDGDGTIVFLDTAYYPAAPDKDEAAFIVKAVNSHDKLVEALREVASGDWNNVSWIREMANEALEGLE